MASRNKALSLYKSILRAHDKFLPHSMRQLGDAYVKAEFRLHKNAKPEQTQQFFVEWEKYLQHIERTGRGNQSMDVGLLDKNNPQQHPRQQQVPPSMRSSSDSSSFGKDLSTDAVLNEEQEGQLDKLREEAARAGAESGI
mmetsp:Transcript_21129/g.27102  ORF Transcript_21129/g.27102 Transcript_21129/m.27102 type:complete len:140 (+) Transcript_21129:2-421(+)